MITLPAIIDGLSLTLLHFLWQGAVLGLIAFILHHLLARMSPRVRYAVHMSILVIMVPCAIATAAYTWPGQSDVVTHGFAQTPIPRGGGVTFYSVDGAMAVSPTPIALEPMDVGEEMAVSVAPLPPVESSRSAAIPWADIRMWTVYAYGAGVLCMVLRLLFGMYGGQRLRSRSTAISEESILQGLAAAAGRVGTRFTPAIAHCAHITAPTVVGLLRPMILVPLSFTNGLSPEQIEMILAHELAHIRRYDHWANLFQRIAEALLFFHPAVWYVSGLIRHERELCCDDIVIATGGERLSYADSLVRVAESAGKTPALGLSASGADKNLRARVLRLIEGSEPVRLRMGRAVVISLGLIFILGGGVLFAQSRQVDEPVVSETMLEPQAEPSPEPTQLAQVQEPTDEPSASEAELKEAAENARREEQEKLQSERRRQIAAELAEKVAQRNATATRFTPYEVTATTNLTMAEPDLFSSCHEIAFDDTTPVQSFAQPGMAAAVSFRILHYLPPDIDALDLPGRGSPRLLGLRVFGQRYGTDYDSALAPFIVTVQGDDTILSEQAFPYSIFGEEPGWADIVFPVGLSVRELDFHRALTISIDPNNSAERGLRIFATGRSAGRSMAYHARIGTVEKGFESIADSGEWMIRPYVGRKIAPIALLQEAVPSYDTAMSGNSPPPPPVTGEAVAIYQRVMNEFPQSPVALDAAYMLAQAYGEVGKIGEAMAVIRNEIDPRIVDNENEQLHARGLEAHYWKESGELSKALDAYERAPEGARYIARYWRLPISYGFFTSEAERLREELRTQRVQSLLGMISEGDEPARAETTEAARARYEARLAEEEWEAAFVALNGWIATLRIEEGRDRQTYLPFFDRYFAANREVLTSEAAESRRDSAWERIHPLLNALEQSGTYRDEFVQWRYAEMVSALAKKIGRGDDALRMLNQSIEIYPSIEYVDPKVLSYYHVLRAASFQLLAETSFDEAEQELLKAYLSDPRFTYVPLSSLRPSYEKAAAPERYLRLVKVIIELTSDKLKDDPDNAEFKSYLQEYREELRKVEEAAK